MVAGSAEILDQLDRISLGEIDLSKVFGTLTQSMTINLDPSLTNVSGITEPRYRHRGGLVTKTLELEILRLSISRAAMRSHATPSPAQF